MSDPLDRRVSDRVEAVAGSGSIVAEFLDARHPVRNISASGLLIQPYAGGSTVGQFLNMTIMLDDIGMRFSFGAQASVVRVEQGAIALRFYSISADGKRHLTGYFAKKLGTPLFNVRA